MHPSSPKAFSRKSRTSRPRSPTSPSTVRSAPVFRAIMPISVLLPTPLPPKIPTRCPRPQVRNPSMARIPQPRGSRIETRVQRQRSRRIQCLAFAPAIPSQRVQRLRRCRQSPAPAARRPRESSDALPRSKPGRRGAFRAGDSKGIDSTVVPRKPTISPGSTRPLESVISHTSPTEQNGPSDSTSGPITCVTRPCQRNAGQVSSRAK